MKSFRADYVFPVCADPIKNGVIAVDDAGKVISVSDSLTPDLKNYPVEQFKGVICPGFINTHCHLELSHLKDKVAPKKGLINFIKGIQAVRGADAAARQRRLPRRPADDRPLPGEGARATRPEHAVGHRLQPQPDPVPEPARAVDGARHRDPLSRGSSGLQGVEQVLHRAAGDGESVRADQLGPG